MSDGGSVSVTMGNDSELCIVVPRSESPGVSTVELVPRGGNSGFMEPRADSCGAPLIVSIKYSLEPGTVVHVFAWDKLTIKVEGSPVVLRNVFRVPSRPLVRPVVEYHCMLHKQRIAAQSGLTRGPLTIVCGRNSGGKLEVAKSLCNYAARSGWKPLWIDADCGIDQTLSIPGAISAGIFEFPIAIGEVMNQSIIPISFFPGSLYPQVMQDGDVAMFGPYTHFFRVLMECSIARLTAQATNLFGFSGAIINIPELKDNSGVNFIAEAVEQFGVANVLCVGDDFLFHKLQGRFSHNAAVSVDRITSSFSCFPQPPSDSILPSIFDQYFSGAGQTVLFPFRWAKPLESVNVFNVVDENQRIQMKSVEHSTLKQFEGCVCALCLPDKQGTNLSKFPCVVFARIESVMPKELVFFTSVSSFPTEKVVVLVGSLRWITS